MRKKEFAISYFYCTSCGKKGIPIARRIGSYREAGHLKKLYCPFCKREVNAVEVRNAKYTESMFLQEYHGGNFDFEGNRILPMNQFFVERNNLTM